MRFLISLLIICLFTVMCVVSCGKSENQKIAFNPDTVNIKLHVTIDSASFIIDQTIQDYYLNAKK